MEEKAEEENLRIIVTEKLSADIEACSSQKNIYRGRVLPHTHDVAQAKDNYVGGTLVVPWKSLLRDQPGSLFEGGMPVVLAKAKQKPTKAELERVLADMKRESEILMKLQNNGQHQHIIRLVLPYQAGLRLELSDGDSVNASFMVMEAIKPLGFDLVAYTTMFVGSKQTAPLDLIRWLVSQVHSGLEHMHGGGRCIVHRDLKPDNVLIDKKWCVKIIDFGYASAKGWELHPMNNGYVAPEVNDEMQPHSIDYWGLGVLVFSMYHTGYGEVRRKMETEKESFWNSRHHPSHPGCDVSIAAEVMDLMKGLLSLSDASGNRWGRNETNKWLGETGSPEDSPSLYRAISCKHAQIYPWKRDVETMFHLTLPKSFQKTTLVNLRLNALILMIVTDPAPPPSTRCCACLAGVFSGSSSSAHPRPGRVINVLPGATTSLSAGSEIYFAIREELTEEQIRDAIFTKLGASNVFDDAKRVQTSATIREKLVDAGRQTGFGLRSVRPFFDVFDFPDHCDGATLIQLRLRENFEIPVAAIAKEDGTVRWWPAPFDKVQRGDRGLVMRDEISESSRRKAAIDTEKVERLQDEKRFRETLGLHDEDPYAWR